MSTPKKRKTGAKQNIHVHGRKIREELVENKGNEVVVVSPIFFSPIFFFFEENSSF